MASGERAILYDKNDCYVDNIELPPNFMKGEPQRWIVVEGKRYVEGGGKDSFYKKGEFAEVQG